MMCVSVSVSGGYIVRCETKELFNRFARRRQAEGGHSDYDVAEPHYRGKRAEGQ